MKGIISGVVAGIAGTLNLFSMRYIEAAKEAGNLSHMFLWGIAYVICLGLFMWFYYQCRIYYKNRDSKPL